MHDKSRAACTEEGLDVGHDAAGIFILALADPWGIIRLWASRSLPQKGRFQLLPHTPIQQGLHDYSLGRARV